MAPPFRRILVAAVLVIVAMAVGVGVGLFWRPSQHVEMASNAAVDSPLSALNDAPTKAAAAVSAPRSLTAAGQASAMRDRAPLPPEGARFQDVFAELKRRADAGEPRAACRLAFELDNCDRKRELLGVLERETYVLTGQIVNDKASDAERRQRQAGRAEGLRSVARIADEASQTVANCAAVPAVSIAERNAYWRTAAESGHLPSLRYYISGMPFRTTDMLKDLPGLSRYKRDAERLALEAAQAGDLNIALQLANAYAEINITGDASRRRVLAQTVTPNRVKAYAIFLRAAAGLSGEAPTQDIDLLRAVVKQNIDAIQKIMPVEQIKAAQRLAGEQDAAWQPLRMAEDAGADTAYVGDVREMNRSGCAELRFLTP